MLISKSAEYGTTALPAHPVVRLRWNKPLMHDTTGESNAESAPLAEKSSITCENEAKEKHSFPFNKESLEVREDLKISTARTTHQGTEETELQYFRFIHMVPDLVALGFEPHPQRKKLCPNLYERLHQAIVEPLRSTEHGEGFLYVIQRVGTFGLCRVGNTIRTVEH